MKNSITKEEMAFYREAFNEAQKGFREGGIPVGSVLVMDGKIIGRGHNQRFQHESAILHGEMDALEKAGRLTAAQYQQCTLYTTLSPCPMCSGAIALYKIPKVIVGENTNFLGEEAQLKALGIEVVVLQDKESIEMMSTFIQNSPELWNEDIGVSEL